MGSVAILAHREQNAINGGALDPSSTINTFYARKLNYKLVDLSSIIIALDTTAYTFTLAAGIYRMTARIVTSPASATGTLGTTVGLYNYSDGQFELQLGSGDSILARSTYASRSGTNIEDSNEVTTLEGHFEIPLGTKTYQIRQQCNNINWQKGGNFCGTHDQCTTNSNVNSAKSRNFYLLIKIGKES